MYKIREARSEDFPRIAAIHDDPGHIHLKMEASIEEQYFKSAVAADDIKMYVVEKSGLIAAFISFYIYHQKQTIFIDRLSIDNAYRKKGLDEHLYHKVERLAERIGMKRMLTDIKVDDPDVYEFFERKGWKRSVQKERYEIELK